MNINDELLKITEKYNNTKQSDFNIATLALKNILSLPFFKDQYKPYMLEEKSNGQISLNVPYKIGNNNKFQFFPENSFSVERNDTTEKTEELDEEFEWAAEFNDYGHNEYNEELISKFYFNEDIIQSYDIIKDIIDNAKSLEIFLTNFNQAIKNKPDLLIHLHILDKDNLAFNLIEELLDTSEMKTYDKHYQIKLHLNKSSYYLRDILSDYFITSNQKEIKENKNFVHDLFDLNSIEEDNTKILKFLCYTGLNNKDYDFIRKKEISLDKISALKEKLISEDKYTQILLNSDNINYDLTNLNWNKLKNRLVSKFNTISLSNENLLIEENKTLVDKVTDKFIKDNPLLLEQKIDHSKLSFKIYAFNNEIHEDDHDSNLPSKIIPFSKDILMKNLNGIGNSFNIHLSYEDFPKNKDMKGSLLQSKFSINSTCLSAGDGLVLFNDASFLNKRNSTDYFVKLDYEGITLGAALFTADHEHLKTDLINILKPYQGNRLTEYFYRIMAEIAIQQNLMIITTNYTEDGALKLKDIKKSIFSNYDNLIHYSQDGREDIFAAEYRFNQIFNNSTIMNSVNYDEKLKVYKKLVSEEDKFKELFKNAKDYKEHNEISLLIDKENGNILNSIIKPKPKTKGLKIK